MQHTDFFARIRAIKTEEYKAEILRRYFSENSETIV